MFQNQLFIVSFPFIFIGYWFLNRKLQNHLLLAVSYFFYGAISIKFVSLLILQSVSTFYMVRMVSRAKGKKVWMFTAVIFNVLILIYFKYYNFFIENLNCLFENLGWFGSAPLLHIVFPLGVSFYTFQSIGYIFDVYRNNVAPSRSLIEYCLFIGFFPKLISGPIERAENLLKQIETDRSANFDQFMNGMILFFWGLFQKKVIADNIAPIVNKVFLLENPSFFILIAGVFAFTIQIFADFSGYTDMARGIGRLLGFDLSINFNNPYFAKNPADFWRRWHISFSEWIRDYLYIPLGGAKVTSTRWVINLLICFFFTGLWHGASWNFILWGLYYWVLYLAFRLWKNFGPKFFQNTKFNIVITTIIMFLLTNFGWLIFRETDLGYLYKLILTPFLNFNLVEIVPGLYLVCYVLIYSFPLFVYCGVTYITPKGKFADFMRSSALKGLAIIFLLLSIILFESTNDSQFIYFDF